MYRYLLHRNPQLTILLYNLGPAERLLYLFKTRIKYQEKKMSFIGWFSNTKVWAQFSHLGFYPLPIQLFQLKSPIGRKCIHTQVTDFQFIANLRCAGLHCVNWPSKSVTCVWKNKYGILHCKVKPFNTVSSDTEKYTIETNANGIRTERRKDDKDAMNDDIERSVQLNLYSSWSTISLPGAEIDEDCEIIADSCPTQGSCDQADQAVTRSGPK
jgi:hypothetical protein